MPSRRTFLKAGVAVSSSNLLLNSVAKASTEYGANPQIIENCATIVDQSLHQASQFSDALSDLAVQSYQINKDISGLWINTLEPKFKQSPFPLAGLTRGAPLFFLEFLSKGYGMRLHYRIEHQINSKAVLEHNVTGLVEHASLAKDMQAVGESWPTLAGRVIAEEFVAGRSTRGQDIALLELSEQTQGMQNSLFSWMLIPVITT